jgi:hypothetical protein
MRSTLGGHIRALARAQAQAARSRAMTGSGQHLASVLQEGWENANIDAGLGFIWRISKYTIQHPIRSSRLVSAAGRCTRNWGHRR